MNSQQYNIQTLRVQLLAMSRLSQRALDYSIKGFEMRNLDFSRHVRTAHRELEEHHLRIKDLSRELIAGGITRPSDSRFVFAALSVSTALHLTYTAAAEIAQDTARLLESSGIQRCAALERMGQLVNGFMRLCVIALFEKDAGHAEVMLRSQGHARFHELASVDSHPHIGRWAGAQGDFERAVTRSLGEVAKQAHEMADAVIFWLEGACAATLAREDRHLSREISPMREPEEASALPYMQSKSAQAAKITRSLPC